eukprot:4630513-Prymnesium_polylepis.1
MDNPDAHNTEPMWLSGPAPLNYFYSFFHTTLVQSKYFGKVHIMTDWVLKNTIVYHMISHA